jgi:cellulose synthase/poly-beta-1,6-N-acetylglucosamine synthase-like glycosyltransferase
MNAVLLITFYFFAAISIWLGMLSLRSGLRFVAYVRDELAKNDAAFTPLLTVFMPLRGVDNGLRENIGAIFAQHYPSFEIIFVADRPDDPALPVVEDARRSFTASAGPAMQVAIAGSAIDRGQKVHNLAVAVRRAQRTSEVFVFVDSDARPGRDWLRSLVAPLRDETVGAATGYRWFVPLRGGIASHLRSVWNAAIASALGPDGKKNFCWGGAVAIRRSTFESCEVMNYWRGTVSDDFALTRAIHEANLSIKFVPQCIVGSFEDCSFRELLEFTTRQLKITRAYAPHLWRSVFLGSVIFVITFFGGLALVFCRAALGLSFATPVVLLAAIFAMGAMKSYFRFRTVAALVGARGSQPLMTAVGHATLWPFASALYLYNAIAAALSHRISWRGITYELKSANETVIIRDEEA